MKTTIELRIQPWLDENVESVEEKDTLKEKLSSIYVGLIEYLKKEKFWDNRITRIIVTDNYKEEIVLEAKRLNIQVVSLNEKEYAGVSKILSRRVKSKTEFTILFSLQVHSNMNLTEEIILSQFLNVFANNIFHEDWHHRLNSKPLYSLKDHFEQLMTSWCETCYAQRLKSTLLVKSSQLFDPTVFYTAFKRNVKKALFEYNGDKFDAQARLDIFWRDYFIQLYRLFYRLIEHPTQSLELKIDNPVVKKIIQEIIAEVHLITDSMLRDGHASMNKLIELVQLFSENHSIRLCEADEKKIHIQISKNPKDYFKNELVDTVQSFVCFLDILGFSDLIEEYDANPQSSSLQAIQSAFSQAMKVLEERSKYSANDWKDYIEYQTFSDNVCISIPYFDNEQDYLASLSILVTYVRGLQYTLMTQGFYLRGGISSGSHYSNDKMIFSKGLVNAYRLEQKKAIYPRIVLDSNINDRLKEFSEINITYYEFNNVLITDWEKTVFLNPLNLMDTTKRQLNSILEMSQAQIKQFPQLENLFTSIVSKLTETVDNQLISFQEQASNSLNDILVDIRTKKQKNAENHDVIIKYEWLEQFIKWYMDDESTLKFDYLFPPAGARL